MDPKEYLAARNRPGGILRYHLGDMEYEAQFFPEKTEPAIDENGNVSGLYDINFKAVGNWYDRMKIKIIVFLRKLIN